MPPRTMVGPMERPPWGTRSHRMSRKFAGRANRKRFPASNAWSGVKYNEITSAGGAEGQQRAEHKMPKICLRKIVNIQGRRFGHLTVIKATTRKTKSGELYWLCRCGCGNIKEIRGSYLKSGNTKTCGCRKFRVRKPKIDDYRDAAEFEARVGELLAQKEGTWEPCCYGKCLYGMVVNVETCVQCRMKHARLVVEAEMEREEA